MNWKPIKGYVGQYDVSDTGLIFSHKTNRLLDCGLTTHGYRRVVLTAGHKSSFKHVHRLVAEAFIPNPDNLPEVNHKDCDKTNNHVNNLEWCDRHWNLQHSYDNGLKRIGENHGAAKLTENDVREIRALRGKASGKEISKMFGIAQCTVSAIQLYRIWKGVV